jgi:hypothetical protein
VERKGLITGAIAAAILTVLFSSVIAQSTRPTQAFMRQKLAFAGGLLEGVTLEKFDLILTNATPLRDMSATNAFLFLRNPDYLQRITNFQVSVDALISAAKAKDLDRAIRTHAKVVEGCADCHKYFRREQMNKHPLPVENK